MRTFCFRFLDLIAPSVSLALMLLATALTLDLLIRLFLEFVATPTRLTPIPMP